MTSTINTAIRALRSLSIALLAISAAGPNPTYAEGLLKYHASVIAQASSESLAPYMLGSWNQGRYAEGSGIWQEAGILRPLEMGKRFSWSVGGGYLAGVGSKTDYARWDKATESWDVSGDRRNVFRITQLFGELKYRAVYLTVGMKDLKSRIVDERLSSGDLIRSGNASAIPGVGAGFLDFVDIPFTNGWVQINGEIMYGKMMDSKFKRREFNYYHGGLSQRIWYNYKRCYFRTNPRQPLSVTVGMQAAGMFGGSISKYKNGALVKTVIWGLEFKDFIQMFFPIEGGQDYYSGNHLGSWDFKADYKLRDDSRLSVYFEWPWEDGSGIGKMNGWDGLWGLQYDFGRSGIISKAVVEYLDFTNQSGPMHFDPEDQPDNPLTGHAQGADNYYNNDYYGAYSNFGMSIGTPFLLAPIYNRNGSLEYLHNRARGFHAAIEGHPADWLSYRIMAGYEKAGGSGRIPDYRKIHSTSVMLEGNMRPMRRLPQFELGLTLAFDKGTLRGDNFGARVRLVYSGDFSLK